MAEITIKELSKLWEAESKFYESAEIGSGVQKFVKKALSSHELFKLKEGKGSTSDKNRDHEFIEEARKKGRRADIVIFIDSDIVIPVEVEKHGNIEAGLQQLYNYQADWVKKYGILTDGNEWRFYNNRYVERTFFTKDILEDPKTFLSFWKEYTTPEFYYLSFFEKKGQLQIFETDIPHLDDSREDFFTDITKLIDNFEVKLNLKGYFGDVRDPEQRKKKAIEITYAYLIQFILYKTLVDNGFADFEKDWNQRIKGIYHSLKSKSYAEILTKIRGISSSISKNIYKRFSDEQESINDKIEEILNKPKNRIDDVSVWLDILLFINRYNFANVRNEIFGYVYENYLKDLYSQTNKGQYFTDPYVVDYMLQELGFTPQELKKRIKKDSNSVSIIDPSCGSGTFLYNATSRIVDAFFDGTVQSSRYVEELVNQNIFGLDIEEFPLYLAEMNILMRMLPMVINEKYNNPIDQKIKVFKTVDSISEFLNTNIKCRNASTNTNTELPDLSLFGQVLNLESFMRDKDDLSALKNSLEHYSNIPRTRFDFVVGNPPYISDIECIKTGLLIFKLMKKEDKKVSLNNIYGINFHSVPGHPKKYRPNLNLYLFFIALGIALLKNGGKMSYIIPQTLLTATSFDVMRYYLSNYIRIEKIVIITPPLFIGRGITQKNTVATSSLIFILTNEMPGANHSLEIVRYNGKATDVKQTMIDIKQNRHVSKTTIFQTELKNNYLNWNFLADENSENAELMTYYNAHNDSLEIYFTHKMALSQFKSAFYFDGGYDLDESKKIPIRTSEDDYVYPKFDEKYYSKIEAIGYWPNVRVKKNSFFIKLRLGSQEYAMLDSPYKIVWSEQNPTKFFFTDERIIWTRNRYNAIGSDNKSELLYLFALLNSKLNWHVLLSVTKSKNEKAVLLPLTPIKKFIRVPRITKDTIKMKKELIYAADKIIQLEDNCVEDFVDFQGVLFQKIDSAIVRGKFLEMTYKTNTVKCKIVGSADLIEMKVNKIWPEFKKSEKTISFYDFKRTPLVDFEYQKQLKSYIDDLAFSLYFNIEHKKIGFDSRSKINTVCRQSSFYSLINEEV